MGGASVARGRHSRPLYLIVFWLKNKKITVKTKPKLTKTVAITEFHWGIKPKIWERKREKGFSFTVFWGLILWCFVLRFSMAERGGGKALAPYYDPPICAQCQLSWKKLSQAYSLKGLRLWKSANVFANVFANVLKMVKLRLTNNVTKVYHDIIN